MLGHLRWKILGRGCVVRVWTLKLGTHGASDSDAPFVDNKEEARITEHIYDEVKLKTRAEVIL